jgi:hypothetical protein
MASQKLILDLAEALQYSKRGSSCSPASECTGAAGGRWTGIMTDPARTSVQIFNSVTVPNELDSLLQQKPKPIIQFHQQPRSKVVESTRPTIDFGLYDRLPTNNLRTIVQETPEPVPMRRQINAVQAPCTVGADCVSAAAGHFFVDGCKLRFDVDWSVDPSTYKL